ncbi:MAG: hypothetical protein ACFFBS_08520 [Promethearchaeota archaeon]
MVGGTNAAVAATMAATMAAAMHTSSYRVKFKRRQFLELVDMADPKIIYHVRRMHFFAFDGFVMYTFECRNDDFHQKV